VGPGGRIVVALAGREGLDHGVGLLEALRATPFETHLVLTAASEEALGADLDAVCALADHIYARENQAARIASGSFLTRGMAVVPCDAGSFGAIVLGLASNLVYRAADVTLKEQRPLVLGVGPSVLAGVDREIGERARTAPGLVLLPLEGSREDVVARILAAVSVDAP
jgi:polyprenyl P-hydroxybenzoate/phenylacrylic acid decarboxylase-like protein